MLCLALPGARNRIRPSPYPDAESLVILSPAGAAGAPGISLADYRGWKTNTRHLFTVLAFYRPMRKRVRVAHDETVNLSVVQASSDLFPMLKLDAAGILSTSAASQPIPRIILSERSWRIYFHADPNVGGREIEVGGERLSIAGIISYKLWQLPGEADAWMLEDDDHLNAVSSTTKGFVVARIKASGFPTGSDGQHSMTIWRESGVSERFSCIALTEATREPLSIFLFTLFVALLALPATTPLPLGDLPSDRGRLALAVQARRWLFLLTKFGLIVPLVYFASLDLSYGLPLFHASSSQYIQLSTSFFGLLFAFRWVLRDQRRRCPVCLRMLTNPARVGEASRNFLAWNGTELICSGGHGLLHIPEIPTSWFSTQRWLSLDPSWSSLFADGYVTSTGTV